MESPLEALLGTFLEEGDFKDRGVFTLETGRARQALADFHLPGPHDYLLFLVSAGVAFGAQSIRIETGRKGFLLTYDGVRWPRLDLQLLFESLLGPRLPERLALRELAVGLLGAKAAGCTVLEVRGPQQTWTLQNEKESSREESPAQAAEVEVQFGLGWLKRLARGKWSSQESAWPEREILRRRLCHTAVPLRWGDQLLNQRPTWEGLLAVGHFEGECSLSRPRHNVTLHQRRQQEESVLVGLAPPGKYPFQVLISGILYSAGPEVDYPLMVSVVDLRRDLSMAGVTDPKKVEALLALGEECYLKTLEFFARERPQERSFLVSRLPRILASDDSELQTRFREKQPLFELWNGDLCTYQKLQEQYQRLGFLPYTSRTRPWSAGPLGGELIVRLPRELHESVTRVFPKLRSSEDLLHKAEQAANRRREFLERPPEKPTLGAKFEVLSLESCELGYSEFESPRVRFHIDGRFFQELDWDYPPGVVAVIEAPESLARPDWTEVDPRAARTLAESVYPELSTLFNRVVAHQAKINFLSWAHRRDLEAGPVGDEPLFTRLDGGPISYRELRQERERRGALAVVRDDYPAELAGDRLVLKASQLPAGLLEPWRYLDSELSQAQLLKHRLNQWREQKPRAPAFFGHYDEILELDEGLQLGLGAEGSLLYFWCQGRPLGYEPAPADRFPGGYHFLISDPEFEPDSFCERPQDGPVKEKAVARAGEALAKWMLQAEEPRRLEYLCHLLHHGAAPAPEWRQERLFSGYSLEELEELDTIAFSVPPDLGKEGVLVLEPWVQQALERALPEKAWHEIKPSASREVDWEPPPRPPQAVDSEWGWIELVGVFENSHLVMPGRVYEYESVPPYRAFFTESVALEEATTLAEEQASTLLEERFEGRESWPEYFIDLLRRHPDHPRVRPLRELPLFGDQHGKLWSYEKLVGRSELKHVAPDAHTLGDLWDWVKRRQEPIFPFGHLQRTLFGGRVPLKEARPEDDEQELARRALIPLLEMARNLPPPTSSSFKAVRKELLESACAHPEVEEVVRKLPLFKGRSLEQLREEGVGRGLSADLQPLLSRLGVELREFPAESPDPEPASSTVELGTLDFESAVEKLWRERSPRNLTLRFVDSGEFMVEVAGAIRVGRKHPLLARLREHPDGPYLMGGALGFFCSEKDRRVFLKRLVEEHTEKCNVTQREVET